MAFPVNSPCPCGSQKKYKKCCKIFHNGSLAKNAKELMKSRYSAFASKNIDYIIKTTHKDNSDFTHNIFSWKNSIKEFCDNTEFRSLEILDFIDSNTEAYVTFKATLFQQGTDVSFTEKSRFLKEENKWLYVDGEFL